MRLAVWALLLVLAACASLANEAEVKIATGVCSVWLPISYDSLLDTPETVTAVRANNRARGAFCEGTD